MAKKDARFYLNGLYLEVGEDESQWRITATDGHRIHIVDNGLGSVVFNSVIIPNDVILSLLKTKTTFINFIFENGIKAKAEGMSFDITPVDGKFPNYRQLIPSGESETIEPSIINPDYYSDACKAYRLVLGIKAWGLPMMQRGEALNYYANDCLFIGIQPIRKVELMAAAEIGRQTI